MIRLLPMFVTGLICNVLVAALVGHVPIIYLIGTISPYLTMTAMCTPLITIISTSSPPGTGTALTSIASLLFALIDPNAVYWAFGFPAAVLSVIGADFVFAAGTIFIAKVSLPHEQSLAGALFQTMTQVRKHNAFDEVLPLPLLITVLTMLCFMLSSRVSWVLLLE